MSVNYVMTGEGRFISAVLPSGKVVPTTISAAIKQAQASHLIRTFCK